jgi:hypothetical protein
MWARQAGAAEGAEGPAFSLAKVGPTACGWSGYGVNTNVSLVAVCTAAREYGHGNVWNVRHRASWSK